MRQRRLSGLRPRESRNSLASNRPIGFRIQFRIDFPRCPGKSHLRRHPRLGRRPTRCIPPRHDRLRAGRAEPRGSSCLRHRPHLKTHPHPEPGAKWRVTRSASPADRLVAV